MFDKHLNTGFLMFSVFFGDFTNENTSLTRFVWSAGVENEHFTSICILMPIVKKKLKFFNRL